LVIYPFIQKKAAEKRELEAAKQDVVRVDDLLTFRQFTKKAADDVIDVRIFRSGSVALPFLLVGFDSMTKMSGVRRGQERCTKISSPT
jgi:hypothetical protein